MFAYIRGKLINATSSHATIDVGGIGYLIAVPASLFARLPENGTEVTLYTSLQVREDSQTLYGFIQASDRDLFEILIGISGIGPKTGLNIISHLSFNELQDAVSNNEVSTLCKVPGIGKKTAERMIIDLRDKIAKLSPQFSHLSISLPKDAKTQKIQDLMGALINLGYNQMIAQKAVKKTLQEYSEDSDLATLITASLKNV